MPGYDYPEDFGFGGLTLRKGDQLRPNDDGTVTLISGETGQEHNYDPDEIFGTERSDDAESR